MEVLIEKLDHFGRGICHLNGKICFVEGALEGEVCDIEITKESKNAVEATLISIKNPSMHRKIDTCPYKDQCGGCMLQHLTYEEENLYKVKKIKEIISKFGDLPTNIVNPIVFLQEENYRNKIVLHGKDGILGLYQKNSHDIISIESCRLILPKMNEILSQLNKINKNITTVTIKSNNDQTEIMVDMEGEVTNLNWLKENCKVLIYNGQLLTKPSSITTTIGDCIYEISTSSFFQVNAYLTKLLYDEVRKNISQRRPKKALDLYTGTGTIAIYIAKFCDSVIGIDNNSSNIEDANKNKIRNHANNVTFICDKVENQITNFKEIDFVIVDPPRSGLDKKTKEVLKEMSPSEIIYVSCDPVTLARDLKELSSEYKTQSITPFNMFPRTYHCESVCILERR